MTKGEEFVAAAKQRTLRECGACSLCCKLLPINELQKPRGAWCRYCQPGSGCAIYDARPDVCRGFTCSWLVNDKFSDAWWPETARIIVHFAPSSQGGHCCNITVDDQTPERWREEPYYSGIKHLANRGASDTARYSVVVRVGSEEFLVPPSGEERRADLRIMGASSSDGRGLNGVGV